MWLQHLPAPAMHEHQAVTIFPVGFTAIQNSLSSCIDNEAVALQNKIR